jgi:predicted HTH domain antitoxin
MQRDDFDESVAAVALRSPARIMRFGELSMVQMTLEVPEEALAALRKDPEAFAKEMRLAAAVKWYELRLLSQGRAARVAGLSRTEFLAALGRFGVTPFQYDADEIIEEASRD